MSTIMEDYQSLSHIPALYLALPYFLLIIFFNWLGYLFHKRILKKHPELNPSSLGTIEGSLLGLTALLLSFAFGMSASKFDSRRQIIVEEANDIGTTILRCDLYSDSARSLFRADLKSYLEARIDYYQDADNEIRITQDLKRADSISGICWKRAAILSQRPANYIASLQMIPSLNSTIDIVTTREAGRKAAVPRLILQVLSILTLVSSFLTGYGSANNDRNKVLVVAFAFMTTITLYMVFDLDRPRQGFINLNSSHQLMINLRNNLVDNK
jgi:CDP-diglyceride synthetase